MISEEIKYDYHALPPMVVRQISLEWDESKDLATEPCYRLAIQADTDDGQKHLMLLFVDPQLADNLTTTDNGEEEE